MAWVSWLPTFWTWIHVWQVASPTTGSCSRKSTPAHGTSMVRLSESSTMGRHGYTVRPLFTGTPVTVTVSVAVPQSQFSSRWSMVTCNGLPSAVSLAVSPGASGSFGSAPYVIVSSKITCSCSVRTFRMSWTVMLSRYVSPVLVIS